MTWVIVFIIILLVLGAIGKKNGSRPTGHAASPSAPVEEPALPSGGDPYRLVPVGRASVVGEQYHTSDIMAAIGDRIDEVKPTGQWDESLEIDAEVRRQPDNPHGHNAVAVIIDGRLVGYIPTGETGPWQELLRPLEAQGMYAVVTAAVYSSHDNGFAIVLKASPTSPQAVNLYPGGRPLGAERQVSVSGEENAQDVLNAYHVEDWVWVSLEDGVIPKGKYKDKPTLWAYVDGRPVGWITSVQSDRYYEYVKRNMPCCCIANIVQGSNKTELQLMLPGSNETVRV